MVLQSADSDVRIFAVQNRPTGSIAQHDAIRRIPHLASLDSLKEIRRPFARNRPRRPLVPISQIPVPTVRKVELTRQRNRLVLERIFLRLARSPVYCGLALPNAWRC